MGTDEGAKMRERGLEWEKGAIAMGSWAVIDQNQAGMMMLIFQMPGHMQKS